ncbi:unnamed protein product [Caenorhabditis angaria]|uniref:Uncharacterized protein n=1 Tax=Caenorhabditis angaria TaxID=860376 RepID=A0A9P1MWR2_9PELO|nr:unnamed protein product [Caenorhabditis angaria]
MLELPFDLRKMIIDRMDSKTRCMFGGVSFECFQDFCSSMDCIQRIRINSTTNGYKIVIYYRSKSYFSIGISKIDETNTLTYFLLKGSDKFCWEQKENIEFRTVVIDFFNTVFSRCRKTLKNLEIYVTDFPTTKINIRNFENLQKIRLMINNSADLLDSGFVRFEQILSASKNPVILSNTKLKIDQILRIPQLYINQMELTEQDVLEYLIFLKNLKTPERRYLTINMRYQKNPFNFTIKQKIKEIFENERPMIEVESIDQDEFEVLGKNERQTIQVKFKVNGLLEISLQDPSVFLSHFVRIIL